MMAAMSLAVTLALTCADAGVEPTLKEMVVFPQGPFWGAWETSVSDREFQLLLPRELDSDAAEIASGDENVQVQSVLWSPTVDSEKLSMLRSDLRARRVDISLSGEPDQAKIAVTGFCENCVWKPRYRIHLGAEDSARFVLSATIVNAGKEVWECESARLGVGGIYDHQAETGAADVSEYQWGTLKLQSGLSATKTLLDETVAATRSVTWSVGSPEIRDGGESVKRGENGLPDRLETFLTIQPPAATKALPAGDCIVLQGGRPIAAVKIPFTEAGRSFTVSLGKPAGIEIRREETELERKQSSVQRENEYYDWVRMSGVLTIRNRRTDAVAMNVVKEFEGEGTAASDEGRIARSPNVIGGREAASEIQWNVNVGPGEQKRLTYGYLLHLSGK